MRPFVSKFIENRLGCLFKTSIADNMAFTAAATFACGLFSIAGEPLKAVYPFAFAVMALAWICASLAAGFLRQWLFTLYSAAFWLLPPLFAGASKNEGYTALNGVLAHLAELVSSAAPALLTGSLPGGDPVCRVFAAASLVLFLAGFIGRRNARSFRLYCEIRLRIIQDSQG